jgi:hypothetical protein
MPRFPKRKASRQKRDATRVKASSVAVPQARGPAAKRVANESADGVVVRLPGREFKLPAVTKDADIRTFQRDAMYWAYVVRSRRRWAGTELASESPIHRLLNAEQLAAIAEAGIAEIDVPFKTEQTGWEFRVLPWEHLLSEATKPYRGERHVTVIRRLRTSARSAAPRDELASVAMVESAPGPLAQFYDVKFEGDLMLATLGLAPNSPGVTVIPNPTAKQLIERLRTAQPTLVHLAGVDTHQAQELLQLPPLASTDNEAELDGLALAGSSASAPAFVNAIELAAILSAAPQRPELVMCNFYNSAPRIAALAVARGARCAIGYQDVIEDSLASAFCTSLYRSLREGASVLDSFRNGVAALRLSPLRLKGAGIVLWSADSLVDAAAPRRASAARTRRTARQATVRQAADVSPAERIRVDPKPHAAINYSLLHNRRSLFKTLDIHRLDVAGPIDGIEVSATLYVGQESFPFQLSTTMKANENYLPIAERVVVPLTSSIIRTQGESLQSSLYLNVRCGGTVVYADTSRVQLSPVDEWTDTDENRWWLPSFVLPRDPTVAKIIDRAQRYLMAIADDPNAGFDGYQSVDETAATFEERYGPVDLQVRAIWSALLHDYQLFYVNPPPSYSPSNQRLRTPSDIIRGNRGTCIDLALLLSACLEYVDIYPVVFLLEGHAFPGYWRSEQLHDDYRQLKSVPLPEAAGPDALRASERSTEHFEDSYALKNFLEARALIADGHVVPLETVWLTNHSAFSDAIDEGRKNLRNAREFDSMIDIALARNAGVTPLPILWRND